MKNFGAFVEGSSFLTSLVFHLLVVSGGGKEIIYFVILSLDCGGLWVLDSDLT